jgi:nuclear transport factor 2 (NTF2) superfamily protein
MAQPCDLWGQPCRGGKIPDCKWNREIYYRLIKELGAFTENRITVRYAYE